MYSAFVSPGTNRRQLEAILGYSSKHTDLRIAMFVVARNDLRHGAETELRNYVVRGVNTMTFAPRSFSRGRGGNNEHIRQ
jgi:hypothetical protein